MEIRSAFFRFFTLVVFFFGPTLALGKRAPKLNEKKETSYSAFLTPGTLRINVSWDVKDLGPKKAVLIKWLQPLSLMPHCNPFHGDCLRQTNILEDPDSFVFGSSVVIPLS